MSIEQSCGTTTRRRIVVKEQFELSPFDILQANGIERRRGGEGGKSRKSDIIKRRAGIEPVSTRKKGPVRYSLLDVIFKMRSR